MYVFRQQQQILIQHSTLKIRKKYNKIPPTHDTKLEILKSVDLRIGTDTESFRKKDKHFGIFWVNYTFFMLGNFISL